MRLDHAIISLLKYMHHCCCWQWNFRIGFTPREGLVIYSVAYVDGNRGRRPVAHRLSFVEMVVPYGDPNDPHYRKNAFDAGEDGLGKNAHSLKRVWPIFYDIFINKCKKVIILP